MPIYIPYFFVTLGISLLAMFVPDLNSCTGEFENEISNRNRYKQIILCITIILFAFCAFKMVSADSVDEYAYRRRFNIYANYSFQDVFELCGGEYINGILVWLSTRIFHDTQGIFIVFNGLSVIFYLKAIKKYSIDYSFGIMLLMATGIISTSFNITQQSLACAIFACYCDVINDRRLFRFALLVAVCFLIHKASLIMILFYLCGRRSKGVAKVYVYIPLVAFVVGFLYRNIGKIAPFLGMLDQYVAIAEQGHAGVNILTIIINGIPGVLALLSRNMVDDEDGITALSANMCLIHMGIYMASYLDRYIARMAMFSAPFVVIFLSRSRRFFRTDQDFQLFKILAVSLYSIELFLRMRGTTYMFNFVL